MSDINEKSGFAFTFQPVTKLFEEQVRLHPEKCAVASGKESFTYAELNEEQTKLPILSSERGPVGRLSWVLYWNAAVIFMQYDRVF